MIGGVVLASEGYAGRGHPAQTSKTALQTSLSELQDRLRLETWLCL